MEVPVRLIGERRWGEDAIKGVLALCALVSVLTTAGIVVALLQPALEFFGDVGVREFFTTTRWAPRNASTSAESAP